MNVKHPAYVIGFVVVIAAVFTAAVMALQMTTRGRIRQNESLARQRALVEILFKADTIEQAQRMGLSKPPAQMTGQEIANLYGRRVTVRELPVPDENSKIEVVIAYLQDMDFGAPRPLAPVASIATKFAGTGFWDRIEGYVALTPDLKRIQGTTVLTQRETPGLGGRVTEPEYLAQFVGLAALPANTDGLYIYMVREMPPAGHVRHGRAVEAITGATQTSLALGRILNADLRRFELAIQSAGLLPELTGTATAPATAPAVLPAIGADTTTRPVTAMSPAAETNPAAETHPALEGSPAVTTSPAAPAGPAGTSPATDTDPAAPTSPPTTEGT